MFQAHFKSFFPDDDKSLSSNFGWLQVVGNYKWIRPAMSIVEEVGRAIEIWGHVKIFAKCHFNSEYETYMNCKTRHILLGNYLQSANWKSCWKLWVKKSMFNFGTPFLAGGSQSSWRQKPHHKTLMGLLLEMIFQGFDWVHIFVGLLKI